MIRSINHSSKDYVLQITGITWKKNYDNLFDYDQHSNESLISFEHQLSTNQSFFLLWRNKKSLQLAVQTKKQLRKISQNQIDKQVQLICAGKISIKEKIFTLKLYQPDEIFMQPQSQKYNASHTEHHIVVRSLKNQDKQLTGYIISKILFYYYSDANNIIKLGNCEFFVHLVNLENQDEFLLEKADFKKDKATKTTTLQDVTFFINSNQKVYDANSEDNHPQAQCKYCMMPDSEDDGEFLCSPCKCSGSCGLVHFNCLVKWNHNKVKKTQGKGCTQYNFDKFFCQVCKQEYPQFIKKHKKVHEILPISKPKGDFIVIEALNSLKRHIIIIENVGPQGIVLGRGQQSDLRLDEPTISRRHAHIRKQGNIFKLHDLKSKFGTLVRDICLSFPLKKGQKFSIQNGRSVISFALMKRSNDKLHQTSSS